MEEKVLFSFDEVAATSEAKKLEEIRDKMQLVVDRFLESVPKTSSFTIEEITPFVVAEINRFGVNGYGDDIGRQAKILLAKKIVGKNQIGGLSIVWEKFVDQVETPNTDRIEQAIREARVKIMVYDDPSPFAKRKVIDNPLSVIQIAKNQVELISGTIERVHGSNKKYIETEDQQYRLERAQKLAEALNEIVEAGTGSFIIANPGDIGFIVEMDKHGFFKPSWGYVNAEW